MVSMEYLCGLTLFLSVNLIFDASMMSSNLIGDAAGTAAFAGCFATTVWTCFIAGGDTSSCAPVRTVAKNRVAATSREQKVNLAAQTILPAAVVDVESEKPGNIERSAYSGCLCRDCFIFRSEERR